MEGKVGSGADLSIAALVLSCIQNTWNLDSSLQCLSQTYEIQVPLLNAIPVLVLNRDSAERCLGKSSKDCCGTLKASIAQTLHYQLISEHSQPLALLLAKAHNFCLLSTEFSS